MSSSCKPCGGTDRRGKAGKLTEEEKQEARRKAVAQYQQMELQKLQNRNKPTAKKETQVQPSLFDF